MKLSFTRRPAYHGDTQTKNGLSAQFFENDKGIDYLKVASDSPRQVIEIPVSLVEKALEARWDRDSRERSERIKQASLADAAEAPDV